MWFDAYLNYLKLEMDCGQVADIKKELSSRHPEFGLSLLVLAIRRLANCFISLCLGSLI